MTNQAAWPDHDSFFDSWDTPLRTYIDSGDFQLLSTAFPSSVVQYESPDPTFGIYPVTTFDADTSPIFLAIAATGVNSYGTSPQWIAAANMHDGWYWSDGSFDPLVETNAHGYPGVRFTVDPDSRVTLQTGEEFLIHARGGDANNDTAAIVQLDPGAGNEGSFTINAKLSDGGVGWQSYDCVKFKVDSDARTVKLSFFEAAVATQAAYVAPASVTAEQLGQILIDYGLMKAS